nr:unnamed protein product [Callosobruchus analis]
MSGHRARMMLQLIAEQTNNLSGGLISEVAAEEQSIDEFCCDNDLSSIQEVASHTKVNVENNTYDPYDDTNANNSAGSSSQKHSPLDDTTDDPDYSSYESSSTTSDNASKINKKRTIKNPCPPPEKQKNLTKKLRDSGLAYTSVKVTKKSDGSKERELVSREEKKNYQLVAVKNVV